MTDETPRPVDDPVKQSTPIAWYDAATIKGMLSTLALLIGTIATVFFGVDQKSFTDNADKLVGALTAFIVVAAPIGYTIWARFKRPTPPLAISRTAAKAKTQEMVDAGILPPKSTPEVKP